MNPSPRVYRSYTSHVKTLVARAIDFEPQAYSSRPQTIAMPGGTAGERGLGGAGDVSRISTQGMDAPRKVVGFHVEGAVPSPADQESLIYKALKSGSLSPVIIPPSFQQGQRSPGDSPRQLGSAQSSRRASEDTSRPGSRVYSPQTSKRNSLDEQQGWGGQIGIVGSQYGLKTVHNAQGAQNPPLSDALPLTPIDLTALSTQGPDAESDERDLTTASERAIELLRMEEAKQANKQGGNGGSSNRKSDGRDDNSDGNKKPYEIPEKKKMTKAERRALQEAQRAAKADNRSGSKAQTNKNQAKVGGGGSGGAAKKDGANSNAGVSANSGPIERQEVQRKTSKDSSASSLSTLAFFDHLPRREQFSVEEIAAFAAEKAIPVPCLALGMKMLDGSLRGTNNRSLAFLQMIDEVVPSFELSEGQSFTREFTLAVKNMVSFLVRCRPLSPAVGNVVKSIKAELGHLATQTSLSNEEARNELRKFVATFAQDKISAAQHVLAGMAADKINDGDIILTYARSSSVEQTLKLAASSGKKFSVVVADSSPLYEGKALLNELLGAGIPCEYMLFNSLETGMNLANKVMLGAAAVMSNGAVLSRAGTAACALSASLAHVPVIVCSETYKFHERVQLDSIMNNELADPESICGGWSLGLSTGSSSKCMLNKLNIVYDLTASDFINVVITEVGALPPTSVRLFCPIASPMLVAHCCALSLSLDLSFPLSLDQYLSDTHTYTRWSYPHLAQVPVVLREFRSQSELLIQTH